MRRPGATSTVKPLTNSQHQSLCTARRVLQPWRSTAPRVSSPTLYCHSTRWAWNPLPGRQGGQRRTTQPTLRVSASALDSQSALPLVHCEKAETFRLCVRCAKCDRCAIAKTLRQKRHSKGNSARESTSARSNISCSPQDAFAVHCLRTLRQHCQGKPRHGRDLSSAGHSGILCVRITAGVCRLVRPTC